MDNDRSRAKMVTQYFITRDTLRIDPENNAFAIVGSLREIGCWDPSKCVIARQSQKYLHTWVATVKLPAHSFFEWKWIVVSSDGSRVFRWEERDNQRSVSGKIDGCFKNSWNECTRYETGLSLVAGLLIPETYGTPSSKPLPSNVEEVVPSINEVAQNNNQVSPSVDIVTTGNEVRSEVETDNSNKQITPMVEKVTCVKQVTSETALVDESVMTNNTVDFKNEDMSKTDLPNVTENVQSSVATGKYTQQSVTPADNEKTAFEASAVIKKDLAPSDTDTVCDSISHSSEILIAQKNVMKTSNASKSQETSQAVCIAVCNSPIPVKVEQSESSKGIVPTCFKTDQTEISPMTEISSSNEKDLFENVSDQNIDDIFPSKTFERNENGTRMPICDIIQQEINTSVNSPVCDNYEKPVHKTEKKSEIFDLVQRQNFTVSQCTPVFGTFDERTEQSEIVPVHNKFDNVESDRNPPVDNDMKFSETEDTEPLLSSSNTELTKESKPDTKDVPRGECDSFLSGFLDWACRIL